MKNLYKNIVEQMISSGKRIHEKAGKIPDIGVAKKNLTEEDIKIERELKQVIKDFDPNHEFYSEEENTAFLDADDIWVADPISGTQLFIEGLPHYGIVIAHIHHHKIQFAAIYDPSTNELYTAYINNGAYLNNQQIFIREKNLVKPKVILNLSPGWEDTPNIRKTLLSSNELDVHSVLGSHAINNALVARGRFDGVLS